MASSPRPALRASTERSARQTSGRFDKHTTRDFTSVATRRSAQTAPLLALGDGKSAKQASPDPLKTALLTRNKSRKRSAPPLSADAPAPANARPPTRPPTKVTVTQPHGELLRITNGVPARLGLQEDELPSGASTPQPDSAHGGLAVPGPATSTQTQTQDKRSLRSQGGGSRLKSDLAIYFSNYDDIIAGLPEPSDSVDIETPIYIIDEPLKSPERPRTASPESSRKTNSPIQSRRKSRALTPSQNTSSVALSATQSSTAYQVLDYSTIARHLRNDDGEDPLADSVYFTQHRRAERKEKQLRNIEKERAMHEKVQLERLLDGLLGPDWLKVMGITGVTDGERKDWEPKRSYFIKEVEALVDKFRIWKEEEKRLRAEKEAAAAARDDEEDQEEGESSESDGTNTNMAESSTSSHREEKSKPPQPRRPPRPHGYLLPPPPPAPPVPFTSFYSKPHLRAAALGKHRHGRNATAFGQAIPEFSEHEFGLPEDYVTPDALRDHARKRRRQKRESGAKT